MKRRHFVLVVILILFGLFMAFSAAAHPYDEPLIFCKHLAESEGKEKPHGSTNREP
jgi:hypothetical protein